MEFDWTDDTIQVPVPLHQLSQIISAYQQMFRALEPHFNKLQMQAIFREFLADLHSSLYPRLDQFSGYNPVSGPRIKEQLEYLLDSLKKIYIKMDLTLEDFEIKIKELIYSRCKFA